MFPISAYLAFTRGVIFLFTLYQFIYFMNPRSKWWNYGILDLPYSFYVVLTLLLITVINWKKLENRIFAIPQFKWLFGIGLLYVIASTYAVSTQSHKIAVDAMVTAIVIITLVYKLCVDERALQIIIKGYVFSASYMGYYITQIGRTSNGRYSGGGMVDAPTENGIGAAIAPALVFAAFYIWKETGINRLLFLVAGAFMANGLVQIGSRSAFLAVAVGVLSFFLMLFFSKKRKKNQRKQVLVMILIALAAIPFLTDKVFWDRFSSIKTSTELTKQEQNGGTRVYFWIAAWDMAKDHPFGAGANGFIVYSPSYIDKSINTGASRNRAVHSTWFEALTEIGYPGFICLLLLIYTSLNALRKSIMLAKHQGDIEGLHVLYSITSVLLCFIVSLTFMNRLRAEVFYWLILFSMCAYNIYYIRRVENN